MQTRAFPPDEELEDLAQSTAQGRGQYEEQGLAAGREASRASMQCEADEKPEREVAEGPKDPPPALVIDRRQAEVGISPGVGE
jgi:hypothetical protein